MKHVYFFQYIARFNCFPLQCYEWVLREAGQLDWAEDSAKALVVIGDDVPHPPSMTDQDVHWRHEIQMLKAQGVKVSCEDWGQRYGKGHIWGVSYMKYNLVDEQMYHFRYYRGQNKFQAEVKHMKRSHFRGLAK